MTDGDGDGEDLDALASVRADEAGAREGAKERVLERLTIGLGTVPPAPPAKMFAGSHPLLGHPLTLFVAFALAGGTGAAAYATFARSPTVVYVDRPVNAPEPPSARISGAAVTVVAAPSA